MTPAPPADTVLGLVQALAEVATADSEYRNIYLGRARNLLAPVMSRAGLHSAREQRDRLQHLRDEATRTIEAGEWSRVRELASTIGAGHRRLQENEPLVEVAAKVYEADASIGREALPASTVSPLSTSERERIRSQAVTRLEQLAAGDPEFRTFYAARSAAVGALAIERGPAAVGAAADSLRQQAREALQAGRWDALASLADRMVEGRSDRPGECACGSLPEEAWEPDGGIPNANAAVDFGLTTVQLDAREDLRAALNCRCALRPQLAEEDRAPGSPRNPDHGCACRDVCPDLTPGLREVLDLLKHRAFLTSLGTRYLPVFKREAVLLETFPEGNAECGPLLERLGLPRRIGLSRAEIERALVLGGGDVVRGLGLDPLTHVLVPVPFDVYLRAPAELGFGQRPHWTHLDGYQVLRGWRLRALVGGNALYGGVSDLCSLSREDARDDVLLRLCVLRRRHLQEYIGRSGRLVGGQHA